MRTIGSYRGIMLSIPPNDDGVWHYFRRLPERPQRSPSQGFTSRTAAIAAAENAIDDWLGQLSDGCISKIGTGANFTASLPPNAEALMVRIEKISRKAHLVFRNYPPICEQRFTTAPRPLAGLLSQTVSTQIRFGVGFQP